jgi:hypothetical protein
MAFELPPWISGINPAFYQSALEAGAKTGLAVADQAQRAQQIAEARAEREAQAQERQQAAAERQREFDTSHLLNVQKVAQDAAQLQQQIAHQTALEKNHALQESRLLDYQKGMLGVRQQQANQANKPVTPSVVDLGGGTRGVVMGKTYHPLPESSGPLDTTTKEMLDPTTGQRMGVLSREGPRSQRFTPDAALSPAQNIAAYGAEINDILKELDSIDMLAAGRNPDHPKHAHYEELQRELAEARKLRGSLIQKAPTVLAPGTNAPMVLTTTATNSTIGATSPTALAPTDDLSGIDLTGPEMNRGTLSERMIGSTRRVGVLGQGTREDPAKPTTQEQFDSMPSGTIFINPKDGKLRQKK